eukprot:1159591-Pelagomonas_calceolata.AAC.8
MCAGPHLPACLQAAGGGSGLQPTGGLDSIEHVASPACLEALHERAAHKKFLRQSQTLFWYPLLLQVKEDVYEKIDKELLEFIEDVLLNSSASAVASNLMHFCTQAKLEGLTLLSSICCFTYLLLDSAHARRCDNATERMMEYAATLEPKSKMQLYQGSLITSHVRLDRDVGSSVCDWQIFAGKSMVCMATLKFKVLQRQVSSSNACYLALNF